MNLYYRDEIRTDFAAPLFVMMRRDPRAIIASQKMRWKVGAHGARDIPARDIARVRHAGHPILQLALLRKTLSAMAQAETEPDVLTVSYEHMVTSPEAVLADLAAKLGLADDPAMLEVSDAGSSHTAEGERRGFDPTRLEGWHQPDPDRDLANRKTLCQCPGAAYHRRAPAPGRGYVAGAALALGHGNGPLLFGRRIR